MSSNLLPLLGVVAHRTHENHRCCDDLYAATVTVANIRRVRGADRREVAALAHEALTERLSERLSDHDFEAEAEAAIRRLDDLGIGKHGEATDDEVYAWDGVGLDPEMLDAAGNHGQNDGWADADDEADYLAWERRTFPDDDEPICYCRRCYIHDDPGGCLVAEADSLDADLALTAAVNDVTAWEANPTTVQHTALARRLAAKVAVLRRQQRIAEGAYDLDPSDLPGWDAPTVYVKGGDWADNSIYDGWDDNDAFALSIR